MAELGECRIENDHLMVRCKDGWLVAEQAGDPGLYDEIEVYLMTDDGRTLQLAIIGRTEDAESFDWMREVDPEWQPMHVYAYDGRDDDVAHEQYVTVDEHSDWY